jgi:putative two-component system response regulator
MAIADVYDALVSHRLYKESVSHGKTVDITLFERGLQFDPQLINAFLEIHATFQSIAEQFADAGVTESLHSTHRGGR